MTFAEAQALEPEAQVGDSLGGAPEHQGLRPDRRADGAADLMQKVKGRGARGHLQRVHRPQGEIINGVVQR
jgi:hypothetical protein